MGRKSDEGKEEKYVHEAIGARGWALRDLVLLRSASSARSQRSHLTGSLHINSSDAYTGYIGRTKLFPDDSYSGS